jgi:hypothetical protein
MKFFFLCLLICTSAFAQTDEIEELDPFDPLIEEKLLLLDKKYEEATGKSPYLKIDELLNSCYGRACPVYIEINKDTQTGMLFVDGILDRQFLVSTGVDGHLTPDFDRNPNGRIYDAYSSST